MIQWLRRGSRAASVAVAVLLMCTLASSALFQSDDGNVHLILSMKPLKPENLAKRDANRRADIWFLRPNVSQELLTYLRIDDPSKKPNVTVQLWAGGVPIASQELKKVEEKFIRVKWPRSAAGTSSVDKPSELMKPVELRLLVDGKPSGEAIKLDIYRPKDYLKCEFLPAEEENRNRLIAKIEPQAKNDPMFVSQEPRCRVELILDPDRFSGLASTGAKRVWSGNLTPLPADGGEPLHLVAEDARLRPDKRRNVVTLRADGFDRAFLYDISSTGAAASPAVSEITQALLRLGAPRFAQPSKPVRLTFEADHVADPGSKRLVLDALTFVDKDGKRHFNRLAEFEGDRDIRWFFAGAGPDGGLRLTPDVKDWSQEVDLSGFPGKVTLRLRLIDKENIAETVLDTDKEKWDYEAREVSKTIVLDDTPPKAVDFEKIPRPAVRGKPFVVQAGGIDDESGIREVIFFLGKLPPSAKLPPDAIAVPGTPIKKDSPIWAAELTAPLDARNPLDVSVRFINNVGLSTTEVTALAVVDPPPPPPKVAKKASIAGVVMEGDRPQKGLKVDLLDAAGRPLLSTTTADKGQFVFKDLAPGEYRVSSVKTASNTRGESRPIPLAVGEDKTGIEIKLWRR